MITEAKKYQAFYTKSTPIVDYMVGKLDLQPGDKILEPCGGDGVFVDSILQYNELISIDVCELNEDAVEMLHDKFKRYQNVHIRKCDTMLDEELTHQALSGGVYDKIIANPPYGAWQDYEKRAVLKKMYPNVYAKETYGLFLYRCIELLKEDGILTFIIPDTYLNLHMHSSLRKHILTNTKILELALFPSSFFPGVNFGYANLSIITLQKVKGIDEALENGFDVITGYSNVEQLGDFEGKGLQSFHFTQKEVFENPECAFLISKNKNIAQLISKSACTIGDIAACVTGFYSGNDKQFLKISSQQLKNSKNYDVVSDAVICSDYKNIDNLLNGIVGEQHFVPVVKGGNVKFLKPSVWYMDWGSEAVIHYKKNKKARFQNSQYYFGYGIGVPMVSSSSITASLIEHKLFDQSIVGIFPKDEHLIWYLLAFFNSPTCNKLIRTINPSANNPANYIKKIPFVKPKDDIIDIITRNTKLIVEAIRKNTEYPSIKEQEIYNLISDVYGF